MKRKFLLTALLFLICFIVWTLMVSSVDVQPIGPEKSTVGFATVNGWFHNLTGTNMNLYIITDWLGLVPVAVGFGFAILGLYQWIRRRHILKVDRSLWVLGGFYILTLAAYLLFEEIVINYRPVLINGYLEASYPSSTTLLVLCVMPTAMLQFHIRIENGIRRRCVQIAIGVFILFMVIGRLLSGVHWVTDILGGILLSAGLISLYAAVADV